ncbi:MAG TPA: hypothetical protein VNI01_01870, partial [Elusimicrobiota bacterium]|nr:hypothetical protein [Elusimicrobiota bacterium]
LLVQPAWLGRAADRLAAALGSPGAVLGGRWPEALIGYPALWLGLWSQYRRLDAADSGRSAGADPRPWILLGLFGPAGTAQAVALARGPLLEAVARGGAALAMGSALGLAAALAGAGLRAARRGA